MKVLPVLFSLSIFPSNKKQDTSTTRMEEPQPCSSSSSSSSSARPAFPAYDESITVHSEDDVELMVGVGVLLLVFLLVSIFYASPMPPGGPAKRREWGQAQVARGHVSQPQMEANFHGGWKNKSQ